MKRGDIYWANLLPRSGSEQKGRRPVVVMSHDGFNQTPGWRSIIVVPLSTSGSQAKRGPTVVSLAEGAGGLKKAGIALCHQVTTLDRAKLTDLIGTLSRTLLTQIENGLKIALGFDPKYHEFLSQNPKESGGLRDWEDADLAHPPTKSSKPGRS